MNRGLHLGAIVKSNACTETKIKVLMDRGDVHFAHCIVNM